MGWGGYRKGAGRKAVNGTPKRRRLVGASKVLAPQGDSLVHDQVSTPVEPQLTTGRRVAAMAFEIMKSNIAAAKERKRTKEWCPYTIDVAKQHPPVAIPPSGGMAMDETLIETNEWAVNAWLQGGLLDSALSEGLAFLGFPYLSELAQRPEYRIISETMATEMTRMWIRFRAASEDQDKTERIKELTDFLDSIKIRERFAECALHDGWFGRAHLYLDCGPVADAEIRTPIGTRDGKLLKGKIGRGWLKGLKVIEPIWTYPTTYNASNPLAPGWYDPAIWYVMGKEIDRSRLLTFIGRPVPDLLRPSYSFGGLSMSQMAKPYVDIWLKTRASVAEIVRSFSVMVLKTDMAQMFQPGGVGGLDLQSRVAMFNAYRDNQGTMIVDNAREDFANVSAPLSGLHELQAQAQEHMMSVGRIPAVKFTGMQPSGLNASSEGEIRAWYDTVNAYQPILFGQNLNMVIDAAMVSLWGETDPEIIYEWVPLWSMTEKESAEIRKTDADTDSVYINAGVLDPVEIRTRLANDPKSVYSGLDPDDVPEPPEPPPGEGGEGGPEAEGDPSKEKPEPPALDGVDPIFWGALADLAADEAGGFKEADHPRKDDGKFAPKGAGGAGGGSINQKGHAGWMSKGPSPKVQAHAKPYFEKVNKVAEKQFGIGAVLNPEALTKTGEQKGSNPGGTFTDKNGNKFYVKTLKSQNHVNNEVGAANFYALAGVNTLDYSPVKGGKHVATKIAKLDVDSADKLSPEQKAKARRDMLVHAWLGNWDVAGADNKNLGIVDGKVTVLDTGGALEYRAQGEPKGDKFGADPTGDISNMRDPSINPTAAALFKGMTKNEYRIGAKRIAEIPDAAIYDMAAVSGLSPDVAEKLVARKNVIVGLYGMEKENPDNPEFEASHNRDEMGKFIAMPKSQIIAATEDVGDIEDILIDAKYGNMGSPPVDVLAAAQEMVDLNPDAKDKVIEALENLNYTATAEKIAAGNVSGAPAPQKGAPPLGPVPEGGPKAGQEPKNFTSAWKHLGATPAESLNKGVAIVASKPAGHGQNYGKMLSAMLKQAESLGGEAAKHIPVLKAKMVEATFAAKAKAESLGNTADIDKFSAALGKMSADIEAFNAGKKAFNKGAAPPPPAKAPAPEPKPAEPKPAEVSPTPPAGPAKAKENEYTTKVKEYAKIAKELDANGNYSVLQKGKYKIKNAVQMGLPIDTVKAQLTAQQAKALADHYGSVEATFKKSQEWKKGEQEKEQAALAAAEEAKKAQAKKEAEAKAEEAAFFAENPGSELHTKAMNGLLGPSEKASYLETVKAKLKGSPTLKAIISPHEAISIAAYSGSYYATLNAQMREGVMTPKQWDFAQSLNKALEKLPNYTGKVGRKTNLPADAFAKYKPGMVIEERAFTSTSTSSNVWSGTHTYEIQSKTGKDIEKLSKFPNEKEVLFKSGTRFLVKSVSGTHIVMEEV